MRVIKSINNNAAICEDGKGRELIALGTGIGFGAVPREVSLSDITRTFYGVDPKYLGLVSELPEDVLEFAAQLADLARTSLSYELSPNLPVTLADHISFAIKRAREHMIVEMPLAFDVQQSYPAEYRLGEMAVHGIERTFDVRPPRTEAVGIALSIVNSAISASARDTRRQKTTECLIEGSTKIVEQRLHVSVGRDSFDYARFATHMRYLIGRLLSGERISSGAAILLPELEERYPEIAATGNAVANFLEKSLDKRLDEEERVYLILHVNRVFERETAEKA
ncbi:PRD domain-containing protein [Olsenella sp. Marseille-P4559]|uniref:PRD domain-containing protein n=1 Tax=Olsenella sp. Marseille-P4559 TaxID=2364795 RepID=UPI0010325E19|nr:PRD domain-containing protein [Olsenella sp. Marseille-P4559]